MKSKNYILIAGIFLFCSVSFGQTISNSGFEDWTYQTYFEDPVGYSSSNVFTFINTGEPNARKTTDAYSGDFAVELETVNTDEGPFAGAVFIGTMGDETILGGVPFDERPEALTGFAKYDVMPTDTAYVIAMFKVFGNPIGFCLFPFTGTQNNYEEFTAPIQWLVPVISPDTLVTGIISSTMFNIPIPGSTITVDSLSFTGTTLPFPNGDFEEWVEYSAEEPNFWLSTNIFSFALGETPITKTDDSYEGNFAVRIENKPTMWGDTIGAITNGTFGEEGPVGGMAIDSVPDLISGYYKYTPVGTDTALAGFSLYYHNENTGMTELLEQDFISLLPASEYTYFEIPVGYFSLPEPDTLNIAFAAGGIDSTSSAGVGSVLFIDALDITYKPHIVGINDNITNEDVKVYPNPASGRLFFEVSDLLNNDISVTIVNSQGSTVYSSRFKPDFDNKINIDVNEYKPGVYFYNMQINNKNYNGKFIVR